MSGTNFIDALNALSTRAKITNGGGLVADLIAILIAQQQASASAPVANVAHQAQSTTMTPAKS